jgi:hypothetical protein
VTKSIRAAALQDQIGEQKDKVGEQKDKKDALQEQNDKRQSGARKSVQFSDTLVDNLLD